MTDLGLLLLIGAAVVLAAIIAARLAHGIGLHADLLQAQIPDGSRLHGVEIFELRLPAQANLALIVRDGKGFVPGPTTTLRTGDRLLIVASAAVRDQTERRLRAVGRAGKLAGWLGEHGL